MGTVAEKLTYLNTTKQDLKQAINNLGGDITSSTTFRNYATELDSIYSKLPKVSDTGTSLSLSPTLKGRLGIVPKGNTYQESTTGYQLVDFNNMSHNSRNPYTFENDVLTVESNSSSTAYSQANYDITNIYKENAGKVLKFTYESIDLTNFASSDNIIVQLRIVSGGSTSYKSMLYSNLTTSNITIPNDTSSVTSVSFYIYSNNSSTIVASKVIITKPLLYLDNNNTYEPYTGGTASPNPDYPQEIQSATGTQKVVVSGKNLLPFTNQDFTLKNIHYFSKDGSLYLDGTSTGETSSNDVTFKNNLSFMLPAGTYIFTCANSSTNYPTYIKKYSDNTQLANINGNTIKTATFTLTETTQVFLSFYIYQFTFDNRNMELQLQKGSTTTTYQPYITPEEVDIDLGDIELNKIGDYEDYITGTPDNWVLKKNISKVVLDGSENWNVVWDQENRYGYRTDLTNALYPTLASDYLDIYCDNYKGYTQSILYHDITYSDFTKYGCCIRANYSQLIIKNNDLTTLANFKSWLSTHNTEVLYVLAEETTETITDTILIEQLNELYYLQSYDDTTNIEVTGNLPMRITASAIKGA